MLPAKSVLIVGGGLVGWWAAVFLKKSMPDIEVSILNLDVADTIAETTESGFSDYLQLIGLMDQHLIQYADGNLCFAQGYFNWAHSQHHYFHTADELNLNCDAVDFNQWMLKLRKAGHKVTVDEYSLLSTAAKSGKAPVSLNSKMTAGVNFDTQGCKKLLISYASSLGIKKIDDQLLSVTVDSDNNIEAVLTANNGSLTKDFYVDATEYQGELIAKAMGVEYESWSAYLPFNKKKVVAVPPQDARLIPFTSVQWNEFGWIKSIPLGNKIVCEYIFNESLFEKSPMKAFFANGLDIDFHPGMRTKVWYKNCLAIGSSAVTVDNFNFSPFYVAVLTLRRFVEYWPSHQPFDMVENEFNRMMRLEYESLRDFHSLHYAVVKRRESASTSLQEVRVSESLQYRLNVYQECGRSLADEGIFLQSSQWLHLLMGMEIWPRNYDYIASHHDNHVYLEHSQRIKNNIQDTMKKLPDFDSYIKAFMA